MARYAKAFAILILLSLFEVAPRKAHSADNPCYPGELALESSVIYDALSGEGAQPYWDYPCRDELCRAARDLYCGYRALFLEDTPAYTPMPGDNSPFTQIARAYQDVLRFARSHPERHQIYCALLTRVASKDEDVLEGQTGTTMWTVELAARLTRPNFDCVGEVMAALPRTPVMRAIIKDETFNCGKKRDPDDYSAYPYCRRVVLPAAPLDAAKPKYARGNDLFRDGPTR